MKVKKDFDKLVDRMNRAYGSFLLWKTIRKSISIPDSGQDEANRRSIIMNHYGGIFTGVLYAVENSFIIDIHKFFDKSKQNLTLKTITKNLSEVDKKEIISLIKSIENEAKRIETLRHNVSAHEPKNPKEEKIFTLEIEKLFSVVQQILNIISKSLNGPFMTWELWEDNTTKSFSVLLGDLEKGSKK